MQLSSEETTVTHQTTSSSLTEEKTTEAVKETRAEITNSNNSSLSKNANWNDTNKIIRLLVVGVVAIFVNFLTFQF